MSERFDVIVIGGGPAGLAAGAQAAKRGLSHVVVERGEFANTIHRYQKGKYVMAEPERLSLQAALPQRYEAGSREEVLETWRRGAESAGTNLRMGRAWEVSEVRGEKGAFEVSVAGGEVLVGGHVILAIGLQGNIRRFGLPGDDLPFVSYQLDDPGEHVGKRVVVVGAGDAGIENALALVASDNDVSVVNRREEFDRAKAANRAAIEAAIRRGAIAYYPNSRPDRFEPGPPGRILLRTPIGDVELDVDLVIGRLGALPPRRFVEAIGVEFPSDDPAAVPQVSPAYESNVPGVYVVGALAGYPLIKNCMNQGFEAVEHILGNPVVPADEPILEEKFAGLEGSVAEILERIRTSMPLYRGLTTIQLRELMVDSEVHRPRARETIYHRNDFSDSFYAIESGEVEVLVPASDAQADSDREGEIAERSIPLRQGDFFGEGSLISGRRRSGTVRARTDCVLIETPRLRMNKLIHSVAEVKRVLDRVFISRHLANLVPDVDEAAREALADTACIERFDAGETLFAEGEEPDGLHVIRRGAVTITKRREGREVVVEYVQAGNYVGEMALVAPGKKRSATLRASVATETIRLPTEAIVPFLERHPQLREQLEESELERTIANVARTEDRPGAELVRFLMDAGAGEATDLLLVDEALCVRCDNCEQACAETHGGVSRLDREAGPTIGTVHIATACRHCENPKCMTDCPPDVIRRHPTGEVYIMDGCIGCGNCAAYCPYDVIQMEAVSEARRPSLLWRLLLGGGAEAPAAGSPKLAVKCDLCRKLPQPSAGPKRAACVESCPTGAIIRVDPRDYVDRVLGGGS